MAQFYTLEEAAKALGMNPDDLKAKAQHREIRAFMDSGSWRFRVADIDELARRRGLGSDPDLSLSDLDLDAPSIGSGSGEFNLSDFQIGTDLADQTSEVRPLASGEQDVLLDDLTVPGDLMSGSGSSSTILGMKSGGKLPSDSDVRLVPDNVSKGSSDSDVRLASFSDLGPGDSDVTLINDDPSLQNFPSLRPGDSAIPQNPLLGSSAEVSANTGSDFELTPSSVIDALQPESGSDFELTALDASDEFDATPLTGPGDSDVTAAEPAASGINLSRPSDSGINLGGVGGFSLDADSIELAPLGDDDDAPKRAVPSKPKPALSATPPPAVGKGEKDIFDDTDFEVDAIDSDTDDRTVQLQTGGSDFDLDDSDSASEVFAIDEDDVDENAATSMAPALSDDDTSDEFNTAEMTSGWDVENEGSSISPSTAAAPAAMMTRGDSAEWGGLWVGFLVVSTVLVLLLSFVSIDLMRNLYDYRGEGLPGSSGLIKGIAGILPK